MTARHDSIVRVLAQAFRQVGAVVHVEPRLYDMERLRPDLDILLPETNLMLDVAVAHPCAPSRHSKTPLAAARDLENKKNRDYKEWAEARGCKFLPFAMETLGAYGTQALD